jgi:hypothetical protein
MLKIFMMHSAQMTPTPTNLISSGGKGTMYAKYPARPVANDAVIAGSMTNKHIHPKRNAMRHP